ncbi:hypothetical protein CEXT_746091 [Caerostris extrusa]|uniref:Uncharacterized protein n=1 Tax=Caerostris extrusa TaxID=172846 RepID=A0AAV4VXW7_CAEEX|nr:hypothetical protein CEXT_746091 [Caerostris extrusa]
MKVEVKPYLNECNPCLNERLSILPIYCPHPLDFTVWPFIDIATEFSYFESSSKRIDPNVILGSWFYREPNSFQSLEQQDLEQNGFDDN